MSVSPSVDMPPFGVTIQATVPQRSEIPEGLMNYTVYDKTQFTNAYLFVCYVVYMFLKIVPIQTTTKMSLQFHFDVFNNYLRMHSFLTILQQEDCVTESPWT